MILNIHDRHYIVILRGEHRPRPEATRHRDCIRRSRDRYAIYYSENNRTEQSMSSMTRHCRV